MLSKIHQLCDIVLYYCYCIVIIVSFLAIIWNSDGYDENSQLTISKCDIVDQV